MKFGVKKFPSFYLSIYQSFTCQNFPTLCMWCLQQSHKTTYHISRTVGVFGEVNLPICCPAIVKFSLSKFILPIIFAASTIASCICSRYVDSRNNIALIEFCIFTVFWSKRSCELTQCRGDVPKHNDISPW